MANSSDDYINTTARDCDGKDNSEREKENSPTNGVFARAGRKISDYVRKNPKKTALAAAAVGAVIGAAIALMLKNERKK